MRKILIILIPLLPLIVKGQLLNTVEQIGAYNNPYSQLIFVKDTVRGGQFMPYSGSNTVDNGMVFQDALGRKWIRQTSTDYIDIRWFGAKDDGTDSRVQIINAINSATVTFPKKRVYIPGEFYSSDSINVNSTVEIFGDGNESKIRFAAHKKGLTFTYPGAQYSKLTNVSILGDPNSSSNPFAWDRTKHGIVVKCPVDFNGVWVRYFDGCGIYLVNDLTSSEPGNSNTSTFNDCHAYQNMLHGIFIKGGDVNAMSFTNCDIVSNGGVGIYDKSFLGNNYAYNHVASNGSPELPYQRGLVKSGGTVYACIKDTLLNVAPPNTTYWQDIGTAWLSYPSVLDYNAATTYYAVSSIILEGANQYGTSTSNYIESDQAPGYIDQNNININGNIQTRNATPTTLYASSGKIRSKAAFIGEFGLSSSWLYGGDMSNYVNGYTAHPNYSGLIVGGNAKSSLIKFYDNFTNIGQFYTSTNTLNTFLESGKKYVVTADTVNVVGKLLNNGVEISGGGITQSTLDDSTAALRTTISGKQDALVSGTNIKTINGTTLLGSGNMVISGSGPTRVFLPNDVINNNGSANTIADVTGLSFPVVANNTYYFTFRIIYASAATTTGSRWSINGPATTFMNYESRYTLTATSITNNQGLSAYNSPAGVSASSLATNNIAIIEGIIRPSADGTVIARFASEISGSAITAIASGRSYVEYQIIN